MEQWQVIVLVSFAIPVAIMGWIPWRVSIELGFFGIQHHRRIAGPPIQIRPGQPIRMPNLRSSRLNT